MDKLEDAAPAAKKRVNDIAEALTLLVALKEGTLAELKELIAEETWEKLVDWKWISLGKSNWRITMEGERRSAFYRKPTPEEAELGRLYHKLGI